MQAVAPPNGVSRLYVVDHVDLPTSAAESQQLGFDLDFDPGSRVDNVLGQVLATVSTYLARDLEGTVNGLIDGAAILHLIEVRGDSDNGGEVAARVFLGRDLDDDPSDNFDGNETLEVADASATAAMVGRVRDDSLDVQLGRAPLQLALPDVDGTVTLEVSLARALVERTPEGLRGRLAGVLLEDQVDGVLVPFIARAFQDILDRECADGCLPDTRGQLILEVFDDDADGAIGVDELRQNSLILSLLSPDVDMYDGDGQVNPSCDGVKDALSLGLGFTAVPAQFSPPTW